MVWLMSVNHKDDYMRTGIIFSTDTKVVDIFLDCCSELGMALVKQTQFPDFIFELQQDLTDLVIFECPENNFNCLKMVKIIKRIKPRVPLIVICESMDRMTGGKIYEEGAFHLTQKPLERIQLREIISASVNSARKVF
jgi:DNA-binding NtrC family response regulator